MLCSCPRIREAPVHGHAAAALLSGAHQQASIISRTTEACWCGPNAKCASSLGLVAERVFGFDGAIGGDGADLGKARALGNSMLLCWMVPFFCCFLFYTGARQQGSLQGRWPEAPR